MHIYIYNDNCTSICEHTFIYTHATEDNLAFEVPVPIGLLSQLWSYLTDFTI